MRMSKPWRRLSAGSPTQVRRCVLACAVCDCHVCIRLACCHVLCGLIKLRYLF